MSGAFGKRFALIVGGLLFAVVLAASPMANRTWLWSADAQGLAAVALMKPEEVPLNPFDQNSMLIQPDLALWMLETFDWPYERCAGITLRMDWCDQPLISLVGASLDIQVGLQRERAFGLLRHLIGRGEPLNTRHHGFAPIHDAILFADVRYLQVLLDSGADPATKIDRPGKSVNRFDAFQFARYLESRDPLRFAGVARVLAEYN
ncbi:ankyrin repeat domain-containing protein [Marinobacter sp. 1Y8]